MFKFLALVCLAAAIGKVTGHGGVLEYEFDGVFYQGFQPYLSPAGQSTIQREWDSYNPITDPAHPQISCNILGASVGDQLSATVAAGATVTAYWNNPWPHTIGPVMVYMAKCDGSCTTSDTSSLDWFKIDEAGLISGNLLTGLWGQGELVANNNSWTSTIPASLQPGEYFIRHELLAIHTANIPQFYPNCAQLKITGNGNAVPNENQTIKLPGGYTRSDPGVIIDVYLNAAKTTYQIPGPEVWRG